MHLAQRGSLMDTLSLEDLQKGDAVHVEIVPEKKGLPFLKHVEYLLTSKHYQAPVRRRFSDFAAFHTLLLQKFIYRMVPPLPPKRILKGVLNSMSEREFIEARCRGLQRFMTLLIRHPVISEDELLKIFMTANGTDVQVKMRDAFKRTGDEYMMYQMTSEIQMDLPEDIQAQTTANREVIANIQASFLKLRNVAERMAQRSRENSSDLLTFGKDLSSLGSNNCNFLQVDTVGAAWRTQRASIAGLSEEFNVVANKAAHQGSDEEDEVVEKLNVFLEMLQSYKDLCNRHENGVLLDHQRALQKHNGNMGGHTRDQGSIDQLESRLTQQENAIVTMELRSFFSLLCLHQETQQVLTYLPLILHILDAFVHSQIHRHKEMGEVWSELHPKLKALFENPTSASSGSPPRTPTHGQMRTTAIFSPITACGTGEPN